MQWPVGKKENDKYVPNFKAQVNAFFGRNDFYYYTPVLNRFHDGIDIEGQVGDPILATAKGVVFYVQIGSGTKGKMDGGNIIFIDHGGWFSLYMHLSKITITGLDAPTVSTYYDPNLRKIEVQAGEKIGEVGNTGLWKCIKNCDDKDKINNEYEPCCKHLHFSAFTWLKGNRELSLHDSTLPSFNWSAFGEILNVNPPGSATLNAKDKASDRLKSCVSDFDYWDLDWSIIPIWDVQGTKFDNLGEGAECTIP
jgi:hypothetical protein